MWVHRRREEGGEGHHFHSSNIYRPHFFCRLHLLHQERFEKLTNEMKEEKARSDALVQRMSVLLSCFPFKGDGSLKGGKDARASLDLERGSGSGMHNVITNKIMGDRLSAMSMGTGSVNASEIGVYGGTGIWGG